MYLKPAIDLIDGQAVRLTRGEFSQKTVYPLTPKEYAAKWLEAGAEVLHLVDLDATLAGKPVNDKIISDIRSMTDVILEIGGGVRSEETFKFWVDKGVDRIVVGTKALEEGFIKKLTDSYAQNLVVGLDVKEGLVQTEGWVTSTNINYIDLAKRLEDLGVKHFVYTDISKDGVLQGPDMEGLVKLLESVESTVVLSGGVSSAEHVMSAASLEKPNLFGAIVGKALYEGQMDLAKAISQLKESYA
jgi:phosphoribosylformimino-5-aminoimidazole carboxamide ribotide isomerase